MLNFNLMIEALSSDLCLHSTDCLTLKKRFSNEGASFVTKTLPAFAKMVLNALEVGYLDLTKCTFFARVYGLPGFLRCYLKGIFHPCNIGGICRLRAYPDPVSLLAIRQVSEYFYKLSIDFTDEEISRAEESFVLTDDSLPKHVYESVEIRYLRKWILKKFPFLQVPYSTILKTNRPRFGPGTFSSTYTDDGIRVCKTRVSSPYYVSKFQDKFSCVLLPGQSGYGGFMRPLVKSSPRLYEDKGYGDRVKLLSEVLFVPKDSRGPRTIVREHHHNIRLQMAFHDFTRDMIESSTHRRVNFRSQQINRDLARLGSQDGSWSTFDLKEASDRVSYPLVKLLFQETCLSWFLHHARSTHCVLPSGKIHKLNKLAGMGSGFTFPVMALLIYSAICAYAERTRKTDISSQVYVYGDDIILPSSLSYLVEPALKEVFLKINTSKSFTSVRLSSPSDKKTQGVFRESCGGDYFCGNDVTPVRLRLANAKVSVSGFTLKAHNRNEFLLQLERHCRELVKAQMFNLAEYYYSVLERHLGKLPNVTETSAVLGRLVTERREECDNYGNVKTYRVVVPSVVQVEAPASKVYYDLEQSFSQNHNPLEDFLGPEKDPEYVVVPRKVVLVRDYVSGLSM